MSARPGLFAVALLLLAGMAVTPWLPAALLPACAAALTLSIGLIVRDRRHAGADVDDIARIFAIEGGQAVGAGGGGRARAGVVLGSKLYATQRGKARRDGRFIVEHRIHLRLPADRGFASASAQPAEPLRAMLDRIAVAVAEPASTLEIIGHTDSNGSETYNQQLSIERAEAVMHYLEQHGVAAARMRARGLGEAEPIADNRTVQGRATNRRVDIILRPATP